MMVKSLVILILQAVLYTVLPTLRCYAQNFYAKPSNVSLADDSIKRKASLQWILEQLPPDRKRNGPVSYYDTTFTDWLKRTGELPPDFEVMPAYSLLPDPLVQEENGKFVPIKTVSDWRKKRVVLKTQIQHYLAGKVPDRPDNLTAEIENERIDGKVILRTLVLRFGPDAKAKLTIQMMIPVGKGPFPVFMTQWTHREWAQIAVRRGYVACVLATADSKDDTEKYAEIWAETHDFTRLMRRAYGTSVAIDYLYKLPFIDQQKIAIAGHSRNGKLSLLASAFDERITAVVSSSGGSGAEIPWRYTTHQYVVEDIALLTSAQPSWFHPRLRFFIGNENKLPVDQHSYMALIAPRGLMLSTSANESASNPWGAEQAYKSAQSVYRLLGAGDNLAIRFRNGFHGTSARDIEDYIDFFDYIFKRGAPKPENKLLFNYSFEKWQTLSGESIDPQSYPVKALGESWSNNVSKTITSVADWEPKRVEILKQLQWSMGEAPPIVSNPGPGDFIKGGIGENNFGSFLPRPIESEHMGVMKVTPYSGFGDYLYGNLYFPKSKVRSGQKLPVIIYLHPFDYSKGFATIDHQYSLQSFFERLTSKGYAVFAFDMLGFGNRIDEGTRFYERYPRWSKMGKMVADVKAAVDALTSFDIIDTNKIYTAGFALGATVGLFASALDNRVAGTISVSGFTPWRSTKNEAGVEGVKAYSHLHGLLPRLGFFVGHEERIPFDFQDVISAIAPRPVHLFTGERDWNTNLIHIQRTVRESGKIFGLYEASSNLRLTTTPEVNGFSKRIQQVIVDAEL
jgi:cephalosporin-C deacetylase-like acetyl esterase